MNEIDARERGLGKPREQALRIIEVQPNILQPFGVDPGKRLRHTVDERFDANEADVRPRFRLGQHRFAAAKADFEANRGDRFAKQGGELGRRPPA